MKRIWGSEGQILGCDDECFQTEWGGLSFLMPRSCPEMRENQPSCRREKKLRCSFLEQCFTIKRSPAYSLGL